ncbi:MAG: hypothetical protein AAFX08_04015 [Pseudomonadota bacterium]
MFEPVRNPARPRRAASLEIALLAAMAALAAAMAIGPKPQSAFDQNARGGAEEEAQRNLAARFDSLSAIY